MQISKSAYQTGLSSNSQRPPLGAPPPRCIGPLQRPRCWTSDPSGFARLFFTVVTHFTPWAGLERCCQFYIYVPHTAKVPVTLDFLVWTTFWTNVILTWWQVQSRTDIHFGSIPLRLSRCNWSCIFLNTENTNKNMSNLVFKKTNCTLQSRTLWKHAVLK